MSLRGVTWFSGANKPRPLYAGVKSVPDLLTLTDLIENVIVDIGIVAHSRKFVPYVTLAYLRGLRRYDVMICVSQHN